MAKRFVFRDSKTGRFVRKSTWKKSKKQGGKRYKREAIGEALREWFVSLNYNKKTRKRALDFFVVAKERTDVLPLVFQAIDNGADDNGFDLEWAQQVPWSESDVDEITGRDSKIANHQKPRVEVH